MTKKYLLNPFNALYEDDTLLSSKPEIQEINEYAIGLEDKIEGDFDLSYIVFEFNYPSSVRLRKLLLFPKSRTFIEKRIVLFFDNNKNLNLKMAVTHSL